MASTSTTSAKIPAELKPLFEQSVKRMLALQGFYWGPGTQYANANSWEPPEYPPQTAKGFGGGTSVVKPYGLTPAIGGKGGGTGGFTVSALEKKQDGDQTEDPDYDPLRDRSEYKQIIDTLYGYSNDQLPLPLQWRPREIADINQNDPAWEAWKTTLGMGDLTEQERAALPAAWEASTLSDQSVTGESLKNNPVINAQWEAFKAEAMPEIQNQMALAGLGRSSSAANAMAKAWAGMLPQLYENQLGRDERRIERQIQGRKDFADYLVNTFGRRQFERQQAKADRAWDIGKWYQDYLQSKKDANYQEWARHAGIAENSLFQPFGSFVPSTIGSKTRSK